ncbi:MULTISPECIES: hypothetical protein [unclassified Paenibacillus]|uniref:hypothetical protein n=1 Tax=unclassified Paenibacillus TaxID=185978 RepID=UPI0024060901|nr:MULTISPECIES: hypothetical protein [unclassified Paenibacillus]MDF9845073.1 hypothetical protein [Paenibacillus sp. PastF-2]MDF9851696.1 hypothetical protein [Paenibacillus sp. PastM-2]MDF9858280.1 hypothetical protein [Paenibacillus sp. PastF-1]MDH6483544.1 hypothetical protein [Paenibacillus sp. PastH-2]MDH6510932.1 hypothetical protein [Paenibacillus sp. PastM-3]
MKKIVITYAVVLGATPLILVLLLMIPVKFAVGLDEALQNLDAGSYICVADYKSKVATNTEWYAGSHFNPHLDETLEVYASGNSPTNYLSKREFESFDIDNLFLLTGKVDRFEKDEETYFLRARLNVDNWEIIYPIRREGSFFKYLMSPKYLNIYDFDLKKVVRSMWMRMTNWG